MAGRLTPAIPREPNSFVWPVSDFMFIFSLLSGVGVGAGLLWVIWQSPPKHAARHTQAGLAVLASALIFGRAMHVAIHWSYYQAHSIEIPQVWLGGLSGIGALAGAMVGVLITAAASHRPVGPLADALLPLLVTMVLTVWLACWLAGFAYGNATNHWWGVPARDEWGNIARRVPVQLLGAMSTLAWFWCLERLRPRLPYPGQSACLGMLGLGGLLFGTSLLRADPSPLWQSLRPEAWGALGITAVSLMGFLVFTLVKPFRI
ncbi:MAG: prolipoprotein diacylglyceryl transferase [Anaerolineales bacterium]|nr:prolipoprotein diacylglyceryl transferase [Anaerolineales bacterium]